MNKPDNRLEDNPHNLDKLTEHIEDWLDNAAHSSRLPTKINFSDIQIIAEILAPCIAQCLHEAKLEKRESDDSHAGADCTRCISRDQYNKAIDDQYEANIKALLGGENG